MHLYLQRRETIMKNKNLPVFKGQQGKQQQGVDRLFDDFLSTDFPVSDDWGTSGFYPPVNLEESKDHYLMSFDLPGVKKDEVKIEVRGNELIVSGERKQEHKEGPKGRQYYEWSYGSFERSFTLPADMKSDEIEADFRDGVLYVAVPRTETKSALSVKIGEGKKGILSRLTGKKEKAA